jgi:hypothetical protein
MHRRQFCTLAAITFLPGTVRGGRQRLAGTHPDPRPGITAVKVPAVADLSHKNAGRVFDQVRQIPQVIDGIRCHCGCAENPDHYSLLSCFEGKDAMAQHCVICQGQGRMAFRLSRDGKTLDQVRAAIDEEYGDRQS